MNSQPYGVRPRDFQASVPDMPRHALAGGGSGYSAGVPNNTRFRPLTLAHPLIDETDRMPGNANDGAIVRERHSVWHREYSVAGRSSGLVDWTMSGPIRQERHVLQQTWRQMVGTTNNRAYDPVATGYGIQDQGHGLHTTPVSLRGRLPIAARYESGNPQMAPSRQNRLQPGRQAGRSYSQTTVMQGGQ